MSTVQIAMMPKWLTDLLNDVRLESTMADLIELHVTRNNITQAQAEQLSHDFGIAYPYGWDKIGQASIASGSSHFLLPRLKKHTLRRPTINQKCS